jgi:hypothetical protein
LDSTSRVVGQAKRFSQEIANGVKRATDILQQVALEELHQELETMLPRMRQVIRQTKARIFHGNPRAKGKLLSLFEPSTEVIRKGKPSKPNEFGKMVKLQEAENRTVPQDRAQRILSCSVQRSVPMSRRSAEPVQSYGLEASVKRSSKFSPSPQASNPARTNTAWKMVAERTGILLRTER